MVVQIRKTEIGLQNILGVMNTAIYTIERRKMKKVFIRTKNVKRFVALMDELQKLPPNIPKLALVYGEHGLGKTQTIQWWVDKNDSVYVRATQEMTSRWLLSEIAEELGEEPYWHTQETFELIENNLRQNPKVIIVDEVDYLVEKHTIETLRDLHDKTSCPIVLVGMGFADKKLARYPHLCDRLYKTLKFEQFNQEDIKEILVQLTDLVFTPDAIEYLATRTNQFRQLVKLVNKIEKLSKTNQIAELDEYILKGMLNERQILTSTGANVISELTPTKCRLVGGKS
jgi:DNA transposition AAA+ family ATPase